jgi:hypothetical protein
MGVRSFSRKSNIILTSAPRDLRITLSERRPQNVPALSPRMRVSAVAAKFSKTPFLGG